MGKQINYWKLRKFSLMYFYYVFVDTPDYLADQLFIKHEVKVRFGMEYKKEGSNYKLIFCKIRKPDEPKFLVALSELFDKMLLMGHTDYTKACKEVKDIIDEYQEKS